MVFFASFSYGAIILSQVIRPYSLLVALVALALACFFAWTERGSRRALWGYGLSLGTAVLLHYSAALIAASVALVWLGRAAFGARRGKDLRAFALVHAPLAALAAVLYVVHASKLSRLYSSVRESYLRPFFPNDLAGFGRAVQSFFGFHVLDANWAFGLAAMLAGVGVLFWRVRVAAVLLCATFALNFVLTMADRYPFGGVRQSMYLLPLTALAIGAAAQALVDGARCWLGPVAERPTVRIAAGVAVLLLTVPIVVHYQRFDFLRKHSNAGNMVDAEFPLARRDWEAALQLLRTRVGPDDAVLVNRQTGHYFRFMTGYQQAATCAARPKTSWR